MATGRRPTFYLTRRREEREGFTVHACPFAVEPWPRFMPAGHSPLGGSFPSRLRVQRIGFYTPPTRPVHPPRHHPSHACEQVATGRSNPLSSDTSCEQNIRTSDSNVPPPGAHAEGSDVFAPRTQIRVLRTQIRAPVSPNKLPGTAKPPLTCFLVACRSFDQQLLWPLQWSLSRPSISAILSFSRASSLLRDSLESDKMLGALGSRCNES